MSVTAALLGTGCLLLVAAVVIDFVGRLGRLTWDRLAFTVLAAAAALLALGGAGVVSGSGVRLELGWLALNSGMRSALDPLSGLFIVISFGVAAAGCLHAAGEAGPIEDQSERALPRGLPSLLSLLLAAMLLVEIAPDVYLFLFGWELVTVSFFLLTAYDRTRPGRWRTRAAVGAGAFGKASGGAVLLGLLLLATSAGTSSLDGLGVATGWQRGTAYALLLTGFGVKVGLVPMHVWLPRSYAAAPARARAVMAGAAVNIGFYGLWRTLDVLGAPPVGVALVFVLAAAVSAILGIAHVSVQGDLRRVIAYSSVENAGLIGVGFGTAMVGSVIADQRVVALGLLAATLQVIAHAVAKTLAFATAGTVADRLGTNDLEGLRGVAGRLPWSGGGFLVASLTLGGLPLTIGFVSEWFLLQSLLQEFRAGATITRLTLATAGACVALTVGFAGFAFVRLVGLFLFGPTETERRARARDTNVEGRIAIASLGVVCLALSACAPWLLRELAIGLDPVVPRSVTDSGRASPMVLQPVVGGFSSLSPSWLWIILPLMMAAVAGVAYVLSRGGLLRVRRVPAWRSASGEGHGPVSYTPYGFANPTRRVLANVLRTSATVHSDGAGSAPSTGQGPARYESDVIEVVEEYLYRPLVAPLRKVVRLARRLQSGRLDAYLTYMLVALLVMIALVAELA